MKRSLPVLMILLLIVLLTASCAAGVPAAGDGQIEEQAAPDGADQVLGGDYHFKMSAQVDGLVADMAYDQLQSEWVGDFTVDSEGLITGVGNLTYDALIFAVDEELCGYAWTELGTAVFNMSGRVHSQGSEATYPVKIFLLDVDRYSLSEPEATCDDPQGFLAKIPDQYLELHRDALLSIVLTHLHQYVGDQIQLEQELAVKRGTVEYQILVSLAIVELD